MAARRFAGLSEKLDRERRGGQSTPAVPADKPQAFSLPKNSFAIDDILRDAWKLDHLNREPTPDECVRARELAATIEAYLDSVPEELREATSREIIRRLSMEPKSKQEGV